MSSGGWKSAAETSAHLSELFKKTSDNLGSRVMAQVSESSRVKRIGGISGRITYVLHDMIRDKL